MGGCVSINPLTATVVLIASSLIWGIPGMILSLPLTGMAKVVFDNIESLKPYGFLLGAEASFGGQRQKEDRFFKRRVRKRIFFFGNADKS